MDDKVIAGFKRDFAAIKAKGFVPSSRLHDTGIGKTFEDLMQIHENNNFLADYMGILELKSSRELSKVMITLFTKAPMPDGINSELREKYGEPDSKAGGLKTIHTTISGAKFNTFARRLGFKLEVDESVKKIFIIIKDLQTDKLLDKTAYYDFKILRKIIDKKNKYIAYVSAEHKKEHGKELFHFNKAELLTGLTFDKFIKLVRDGIILYDIRIGVYRSGGNKGKTHDHGSGFRILKDNLSKVFDIEEL